MSRRKSGRLVSHYDAGTAKRESRFGVLYKWIALSNTTIGVLIATIDSSILIIALPRIFDGMGVNPLIPGNVELLIWLLLGYTIASSATVLTIGRLSDMFGRVKLYNLGFLIFAICSILLCVSSYLVHGTTGILSLIIIRIFQGLGGGFLFANSTAILTDAFPHNERGKAMGINQVAGVSGSIIGLLIGGILVTIDWHLVFLVSVPISVIGTIWAYVALREIASIKEDQKLDIVGNATFIAAITVTLLSLSYMMLPYSGNTGGWSNPILIAGVAIGILLFAAFAYIELHVKEPMFHLGLFKIRTFLFGNASLFLAGLARGGLQFMLVVWLQGVWLPLHGVSFANTPFQAGIDMIPLILGFLSGGPISGYLSDKHGARLFSTVGMLVCALGFMILLAMPVNFNYAIFGVTIFIVGVGQGMFMSPNTASIMNSVPPEFRGVASGMRTTIFNVSYMLSLVVFFTILVFGVSAQLPKALYSGLIAQNINASVAKQISALPPSSGVLAAFLGYNPMATMIPSSMFSQLPAANRSSIIGTTFFPKLLSEPFANGIGLVFSIALAMSLVAALASALRGPRYIYQKGRDTAG